MRRFRFRRRRAGTTRGATGMRRSARSMRCSTATAAIAAIAPRVRDGRRTRHRLDGDRSSRRSNITSRMRRARITCPGFDGADGDSRRRRQRRVRDDVLRLRRGRPHSQDQGVLRSGLDQRRVRRADGVSRFRNARRRVQGDGHGAVWRPAQARPVAAVAAPRPRSRGEYPLREYGGLRRYKEAGVGYYFSRRLVDWLGPRRVRRLDRRAVCRLRGGAAAAVRGCLSRNGQTFTSATFSPRPAGWHSPAAAR